jgi:hypothetical protein
LLALKEIYGDLVKALDASLEDTGGRFLEILKTDGGGGDDSEEDKLKRIAGVLYCSL